MDADIQEIFAKLKHVSLAKFGIEEGTDSEGKFAYVPKYRMRPWKE